MAAELVSKSNGEPVQKSEEFDKKETICAKTHKHCCPYSVKN